MNFWGYSISEARVVNYDKNDKAFAAYLAQKAPSSKLCIGCGGCTATCTAGNLTEFNIRKLQMLVKRGENEEACKVCINVCSVENACWYAPAEWIRAR